MRRIHSRKTSAKLFLSALLTVSLAFCPGIPTGAAESDLPSLIHNEEAWYKDAVAPLVFRDGKYFLPAELLSMFDGITVTILREDNLLIQNTATGWYLSVLFREQSAAENGRIMENVGVFRDSGMYYVEADLVCAAVGLDAEYYTGESGKVTLRVSDENRLLSLEELLKTYLTEEEPAEALPEEPEEPEVPEQKITVKPIYVLCTTPETPVTVVSEKGETVSYSALDTMEEAGLDCTRFLGEDASLESILRAAASGAVGWKVPLKWDGTPDTEALRRMNDRLAELVRLRTHLVLSTGSGESDEALEKLGYRVVKPDFVLDGGTEPEELFARLREHLDVEDSCTILMGDNWHCAEMTGLLTNLNPDWYAASGLRGQKSR